MRQGSFELWQSDDPARWRRALDGYDAVVEAQGVARLPELDRWYRTELPGLIAGRRPLHITRDELIRVTSWKMARGVWRGRNLALVRGNDPAAVVEASARALAAAPDPRAPIRELATLAGVGPATASAIVAAAVPDRYPFLDDVAAARVPDLGDVAYTLGFYTRYADALRQRAARLGGEWTPVRVERALWADGGGKSAG
jgi:hypothetical protein